ncbi:MAG: helix-turn-helix domain-containing protein [Planctomycetaceae bacterium]|nr:helix-turn-helix domain-containing protein [Planctomycetaceae bacterium]
MRQERIWTADEVAKYFGVTIETVYRWTPDELEPFNVGVQPGKKRPRWRYRQSAIDKFIERRTIATTPKPVPRKKPNRTNNDSIEFIK